jgi:hypothetical protein
MKFLMRQDHEQLERYIEKICAGKNIPLITAEEKKGVVTYTIDFQPKGKEGSVPKELQLPAQIKEQTKGSISYELPTATLEKFHEEAMRTIEKLTRASFSDQNWEYWNMLENYAEYRKEFSYYKEAFSIATKLYGKDKGSVIDVGIKDSTVVLDRFGEGFSKTAMDNDYPASLDKGAHPNILFLEADLYAHEPKERYDIVLCQQVLEHLEDPRSAFRKLEQLSQDVIVISVPYGSWHGTQHDPINEERVREWTGKRPVLETIVKDFGVERYVAGYKR